MFTFLRKTSLYILALPLLLIALGTVSNQVVLYANHDTFPVVMNNAKLFEYEHKLTRDTDSDDDDKSEEAQVRLTELDNGYLDDTHIIMTKDTHLNWLADVFDFHGDVFSIGDFMLELGEWSGSFAIFVYIFAASSKACRRERDEY